jgi:hypothetical protein
VDWANPMLREPLNIATIIGWLLSSMFVLSFTPLRVERLTSPGTQLSRCIGTR